MSRSAVKPRAGLVFVLFFAAGLLAQLTARAALAAIGWEPPSRAAEDVATAFAFACGAAAWVAVSPRRNREPARPFVTFIMLWVILAAIKLAATALTGGS